MISKYLNGTELFTVSQVCRSWSKIVKNENKCRGLACFTVQGEYPELCEKYCTITREIIEYLPSFIHQYFYMFFVAGDKLSSDYLNQSSECGCKYLPSCCYLISWHSNYPINDKTLLTGWSFPATPKIQFKIYTFLKQHMDNKIYCPELNYVLEPCKYGYLQPNFSDFFDKNSKHTRCMIFLCQKEYVIEGRDFLTSLNDRFKENKIFVWGGVTNLLQVCNSLNCTEKCKANRCFLFILINSMNMRISTVNWNSQTSKIIIKYKLAKLRLFMEFEKHSICLMFCSGIRSKESYLEDRFIFKQIFPTVPIIQVTGESSLGDVGIKNALSKLSEYYQNDTTISDDTTNVMLLTY
ncbi:hypothetical protein M0802_005839 [Mischocyttarus mexicanus]|nr:hypothetical protein M0802_005839 [Mischocyttarus mexicanus]